MLKQNVIEHMLKEREDKLKQIQSKTALFDKVVSHLSERDLEREITLLKQVLEK